MLIYDAPTKRFIPGLYRARFIDSSTGQETLVVEYTNDRAAIEKRVATQPHLYRLSIEESDLTPIHYSRLNEINQGDADPMFLNEASTYVQYGYLEHVDTMPEHMAAIAERPEVKAIHRTALIEQLRSEIADIRWKKETSGIVINDMTFGTTDREKGLLSGKVLSAIIDPEQVTKFKVREGHVDLTSKQVIAIGTLVGRYVESLFAREATLGVLVSESEDPRSVDLQAGWPSNVFTLDVGE